MKRRRRPPLGLLYFTLQRRFWYGGKKGRSAYRRLVRDGYVPRLHNNVPPHVLRCPACNGPKRGHRYDHYLLCELQAASE